MRSGWQRAVLVLLLHVLHGEAKCSLRNANDCDEDALCYQFTDGFGEQCVPRCDYNSEECEGECEMADGLCAPKCADLSKEYCEAFGNGVCGWNSTVCQVLQCWKLGHSDCVSPCQLNSLDGRCMHENSCPSIGNGCAEGTMVCKGESGCPDAECEPLGGEFCTLMSCRRYVSIKGDTAGCYTPCSPANPSSMCNPSKCKAIGSYCLPDCTPTQPLTTCEQTTGGVCSNVGSACVLFCERFTNSSDACHGHGCVMHESYGRDPICMPCEYMTDPAFCDDERCTWDDKERICYTYPPEALCDGGGRNETECMKLRGCRFFGSKCVPDCPKARDSGGCEAHGHCIWDGVACMYDCDVMSSVCDTVPGCRSGPDSSCHRRPCSDFEQSNIDNCTSAGCFVVPAKTQEGTPADRCLPRSCQVYTETECGEIVACTYKSLRSGGICVPNCDATTEEDCQSRARCTWHPAFRCQVLCAALHDAMSCTKFVACVWENETSHCIPQPSCYLRPDEATCTQQSMCDWLNFRCVPKCETAGVQCTEHLHCDIIVDDATCTAQSCSAMDLSDCVQGGCSISSYPDCMDPCAGNPLESCPDDCEPTSRRCLDACALKDEAQCSASNGRCSGEPCEDRCERAVLADPKAMCASLNCALSIDETKCEPCATFIDEPSCAEPCYWDEPQGCVSFPTCSGVAHPACNKSSCEPDLTSSHCVVSCSAANGEEACGLLPHCKMHGQHCDISCEIITSYSSCEDDPRCYNNWESTCVAQPCTSILAESNCRNRCVWKDSQCLPKCGSLTTVSHCTTGDDGTSSNTIGRCWFDSTETCKSNVCPDITDETECDDNASCGYDTVEGRCAPRCVHLEEPHCFDASAYCTWHEDTSTCAMKSCLEVGSANCKGSGCSTCHPPTSAPPTSAPPTIAPTRAPPTSAPSTSVPTTAPATRAPATSAPPTTAPLTPAPPTSSPSTLHPATAAPDDCAGLNATDCQKYPAECFSLRTALASTFIISHVVTLLAS
ncbi:hypothetical protein DIPPA_59798 [Diplonema papillatum]|nr:hypothetical protein DIPPA_59798 [Diplonema papillatum]